MKNPKYIQESIEKLPNGEIFVISDFSDKASYDNTRQIFSRLEKEGKIHRILPGIYEKPTFSRILMENAIPNPDEVAKAIARKNNWTIAPGGNTALNLLGLSTQVSATWDYISSGPSTNYQFSGITLIFTHRANKILSGMSYKTILVIQALNTLGKENISNEIISKLTNRLSANEKGTLLKEAKSTTNWVYEEIKKICKKET